MIVPSAPPHRGMMMSAAFATLLAGCITPEFKPRPTSVTPAEPGLQAVSPAPPPWRTAYGDPQLDQLMADALQALEEAMTRRLRAGTRRSRKPARRTSATSKS
jgi:outer membrane protein TolC